MKPHYCIILIILSLIVTACPIIGENLNDDGPEFFSISIENLSGMTLLEKDNWGEIDANGNLKPSERVLGDKEYDDIFGCNNGFYHFNDFLEFLKEKCPNAYVELYSYDETSKTCGILLRRWSLVNNSDPHAFFIESSHKATYSASHLETAGRFWFQIIPEDLSCNFR